VMHSLYGGRVPPPASGSERTRARLTAILSSLMRRGLPLVDTRSPQEYSTGHLCGSTSLPLCDVRDRTSELPPPPFDLVVIATSDELQAALKAFDGSRWRVVEALSCTKELWDAAEVLGVTERGTTSRRLWEPSPHLPIVIDDIERLCTAQCPRSNEASGASLVRRWRAIDLGCGRGRDAIYLATRGCWEVRGIAYEAHP